MPNQLRRHLFKGLDLKRPNIFLLFWVLLATALLFIFVISNIYGYEESMILRLFKQEVEVYSKIIRKKYVNDKTGIMTEQTEEVFGNLVYPHVDTSNFPMINTSTCWSMIGEIELAPAYSMPLTALASFPRSGNTWTRFLLQVATRYYTSTVYWESEGKFEAFKILFKGGTEDFSLRKGVCTKTHEFDEEHIAWFDNGAIFLIRNPYYAIVSEFMRIYNRLRNHSHPEIIEFLRTNNERWPRQFYIQSQNWRDTCLNWINHSKRLLIVFYEDLTENPVREIARMVAFLGQPIKPNRIQCALYNYKPMDRSQHSSHLSFDPYSVHMHKVLDGFIAEVNETLIRKNAVPLPTYRKYLLSGK